MAQAGLKKIALEEHFIPSEYAQHVRDLQSKGAGIPTEFEDLLAPVLCFLLSFNKECVL